MSRIALLVLLAAVCSAAGPEQPLPFSHKTHISTAKLVCQDCHPGPAKFGAPVGFPTTQTCMACHRSVAADKPAIRKLTELAKAADPIPWVRVYTLEKFVFFDHRYHLNNGATCETCHGQVALQDVVTDELKATKMTFCQPCHTKNRANGGCGACHNYR